MSLHSTSTKNHRIESWSFANATTRLANGLYVSTDVGEIGYQQDDGSYWRLTIVTNPGGAATPTWAAVGAAVSNAIENGFSITSLSGAEPTSLKNKDLTGKAFGYKIAVTIADSDSIWTYQNGAPVAATGDVAVAGNAGVRWRKTLGY